MDALLRRKFSNGINFVINHKNKSYEIFKNLFSNWYFPS